MSKRASSIPGLNQDGPETPWIKEEPEEESVTQEEQLPVSAPESIVVFVKKEEPFFLEQTEETQGEDIISEPHFRSESEGHTQQCVADYVYEDWESPFICSAAQMETEAEGDHDSKVQTRGRRRMKLSSKSKSAPESSSTVYNEAMTGAYGAAERKKHQCPFCLKRFTLITDLQRHIRVHTGEKPYSCSICDKSFTQKGTLNSHMRKHTGEKPFSCPTCNKAFAYKYQLQRHMSTHTAQSSEDNEMQSIGKIFQILGIPLQSV